MTTYKHECCLHLGKFLSVWSNPPRAEQTARFVQGIRQLLNKMFQVISLRSPRVPNFLSWTLLDFKTLLISNLGIRSITQT